jgi:response regulator RpfG family c-di-GMP phosphodiesterase
MSDELEFIDDVDGTQHQPKLRPWKILVVDDEESVHSITDLVLRSFLFEGCPLILLHASSSKQVKALLSDHPDVAVIFLDVVMESESSGLDLVRFIRYEMANQMVRIILRTGQPGQAPEHRVIREYDINDYKLKTELTAQKLQTSLIVALRSYSRMLRLQQSNGALLDLVQGWSKSSQFTDQDHALRKAAEILVSLIPWNPQGQRVSLINWNPPGSPEIIEFNQNDSPIEGRVDEDTMVTIEQTLAIDGPRYFKTGYAAAFPRSSGGKTIIMYRQTHPLSPYDLDLLQIFYINLSMLLDNINLSRGLKTPALPGLLGEIIQTVSKESASHIQRIGSMAGFLGTKLDLSAREIELLRLAASLHDLGKVAIPDSVLQKTESLNDQEREIIEKHPEIGYQLLSKSSRELFQIGAKIAQQHHEYWDGGGYPQGLTGDGIDLFARVVALCDVYDSLCHPRPYREAWHHLQAKEYIISQRGLQFDPQVVDLFSLHYEEIRSLLAIYG